MIRVPLIALAALTLICASLQRAQAQIQLPNGFIEETVVSGIARPSSFAFLPDGRMLVTEQTSGQVLVVSGANTATVGVVPGISTDDVERGLLGIAIDPLWPASPFIYLHYTHLAPRGVRVVRYTLSGDLDLAGSLNLNMDHPQFILEDLPDTNGLHNAGSIHFGTDGMLYAGVGDDGVPCDAADLSQLRGKILRLDVSSLRASPLGGAAPPRSQLVAAGNPFTGANAELVWASGFRNPYSWFPDPQSSDIWVGDVGSASWEEVNRISAPGQDFGWPHREGPDPAGSCPTPPGTLTNPEYSYAHSGSSSVILLGGPYRNQPGGQFNLGPSFEGRIFIGDFSNATLRCLEPGAGGYTPIAPLPGQPSSELFGQFILLPSFGRVGPDGALYYANYLPGSIRRIRLSGPTFTVTEVSGNGQSAVADQMLSDPLVVRVEDVTGQPAAGIPVNFRVTAGSATPQPTVVMTDANGLASTQIRMGAATPSNPVHIEAIVANANPVRFQATWLGLQIDYDALSATMLIRVRSTAVGLPVVFGAQVAPVTPSPTVYGDFFIELFAPQTPQFMIDGFGAFTGIADPTAITGPVLPEWRLVLSGLPPSTGTVPLITQAFTIDIASFPAVSSVMISNPITFLF